MTVMIIILGIISIAGIVYAVRNEFCKGNNELIKQIRDLSYKSWQEKDERINQLIEENAKLRFEIEIINQQMSFHSLYNLKETEPPKNGRWESDIASTKQSYEKE